MTKLTQLWNRAKETLTRSLTGGDEVEVKRDAAAGEHLSGRPLATPPVDIVEGERELLLVADVPGATRRETLVTAEGEALVLHARVAEEPAAGRLGAEYASADWYRRFRLPAAFDAGRARASLERGVLTIRVPRRRQTAHRPIPVKARG
jgi:HSP20 family protein